MSIIEYLSENYEVINELNKGKFITSYDRRITYPIGAHIEFDEKFYKVIRSISGYKTPTDNDYWEEHFELNLDVSKVKTYSQFSTYYEKDLVIYNDVVYMCLQENGYKFDDIRIPLVNGWIKVPFSEWLSIDYAVWDIVRFHGGFYTLLSLEGFDNKLNPLESDCWGAIADYNMNYNEYELSEHEYIVWNGKVFYPEIDVNADVPQIGLNLTLGDPRNYNLKKHMLRLSIYELTKLIAHNNVSVVRVKDYEESMKWLSDASKLKINPQIPRKLDEEKKPVMD